MQSEFERRINFFRENPVTDWHEHLTFGEITYEQSREYAKRITEDMKLCGIDKTIVTNCITGGKRASMDIIRTGNDAIGKCCLDYPDILYPLVYVDPYYKEETIKEIERCKKEYNVIGVKLYDQYTIDDDIQDYLLDYCAENRLFVLMHAGYFPKKSNTATTNSVHMLNAAKKHPDTVMIMAHITGGGDWNHQLRGLENCPNVYVDIAGSVLDSDVVESLVAYIGANRILFGTDGSFSASIGRLLSAKISDDERKIIMNNTNLWDYVGGGVK